jgi:T5SS/PEP-CTERM-associated repeat protein
VGTVTVTGVGSKLAANTAGGISIGNTGSGALTIQSGGQASGLTDFIGNSAGATGTATVTGSGSSWNSGSLAVGRFGGGTLRIESGATATSSGGSIGDQPGSTGGVTVTGSGSIWTVGGNLPVGNLGIGTLTVSDSAAVSVGGGAGQVSINASSTLNIGEGSAAGILQAGSVVNNGVLNFDHSDATTISAPISGNGQITKIDGTGDTTLANVSGFTGSFSAQGGRLALQGNANGSDYVAGGGGTLRFSGGTVNLALASIQATDSGAVEYQAATIRNGFLRGPGTHTIIAGTTFNAVTTFNSANIVQNGPATLINFTNGGTFTNNSGGLIFNGGTNAATGVINVNSTLNTFDVGNSGIITVNNGGIINNQIGNFVCGGGSRTTINSGGAINLLGGTTLELNGALLVNNGTISGTVNVNYGSLAKGTGAYGIVNVGQGGAYAPGNSPGIVTAAAVSLDNATVSSGAPQLQIELGGTMPGTQYDQLHVTGPLSLGGTLSVSLVGGFRPHAGDTFDILDWGALSGSFGALQLPSLNSRIVWDASQLYTTGTLSVQNTFYAGDVNRDSHVDVADVSALMTALSDLSKYQSTNSLTTAQLSLVADLTDDNVVTNVDLQGLIILLANGGGSGGGSLTAVPEPSSLALIMLAFVSAVAVRRKLGIRSN